MILVTMGIISSNQSYRTEMGIGSRSQDFWGISWTTVFTKSSVTSLNSVKTVSENSTGLVAIVCQGQSCFWSLSRTTTVYNFMAKILLLSLLIMFDTRLHCLTKISLCTVKPDSFSFGQTSLNLSLFDFQSHPGSGHTVRNSIHVQNEGHGSQAAGTNMCYKHPGDQLS